MLMHSSLISVVAMARKCYEVKRRDVIKATGGMTTAGIGGLAGCSGDESSGGTATPNGGKTTTQNNGWPDLSGHSVHFITVAAEKSIKDLWQGVAKDFEKATGAKMEVEFVQTSSIKRIIQLLQAGDPPEVSMQATSGAFQLQHKGVLEPLDAEYDEIVSRLGEPTKTVQNIIEVEGKKWMAPIFHNIHTYSYRSDLSDIVPDTWEKALQYAKEVDKQDNDVRGTYVPISSGVPSAARLGAWLWTNDGSIANRENGKIKVNFNEGKYRKRMIELLHFLKDRQQYSPPGDGAGWADIMNIIQSGRAASSWYGGVRQKNQAIRNGRSFAKDIHVIPGMPTKRKNASVGSTEGLIAYKGADTKAAKVFIKYVTRQKFLVNLLTQLSPIHNIPSWPSIQQGDAYQQNIQSLDLWDGWTKEQFENYQVEALSELHDKTQDTNPPNPYIVTYFSEPMWNLQTSVLLQNKAPEDVIDKWAKELQQVVDQAQN